MRDTRVSVIIPVFNREQYLRECLESIRAQGFQDFEVILVDDGSTDGSWRILCEYAQQDSRFSAYRMEKNAGSGPARNVGIQKASGKYCLFCDSDDAYPPYAFQVLFDHAEKYHADVACGNILVMDSELRYCHGMDAIHMTLTIKEEAVVRNLEHQALWWPLYHPKFLISTALLREHHITYPDLRRGQDPVFLAEVLCAAQSVAITPHVVYYYRIVPKVDMPTGSAWLSFLDYYQATLDVFLRAGQVHCACLFYALSINDWHSFSHWRLMSREERAEERAKFIAYTEAIAPYTPWERDYTPYPVDVANLKKRVAFYVKHGHMLSCLHMAIQKLATKAQSFLARHCSSVQH